MGKIYKSALGKPVDMDALRLANETVIAVGNAKVNARGDELGHGGAIIKTRAQIVQEYHSMNAPIADETPLNMATPTNNVADNTPLKG